MNRVFSILAHVIPLVIGFSVAYILQSRGLFPVFHLTDFWNSIHEIVIQIPFLKHVPVPLSTPAARWFWPFAGSLVFWLLFAPRSNEDDSSTPEGKYTATLGKLKFDRNTFCRGWLILGATGTGKTQCAIATLLHQVNRNENGVLRDSWDQSKAKKSLAELRNAVEEKVKKLEIRAESLLPELDELKLKLEEAVDDEFSKEVHHLINHYDSSENSFSGIIDDETINEIEEEFELNKKIIKRATIKQKLDGCQIEFNHLEEDNGIKNPECEAKMQQLSMRIEQLESDYEKLDAKKIEFDEIPSYNKKQEALREQLAQIVQGDEVGLLRSELEKKESEINYINYEIALQYKRYNEYYDRIRDLKYVTPPWGGICVDEKGLYYQTLTKFFRHYDRMQDLCLLQTRPDWAGEHWAPPATFNLLSDYNIPSNTYAGAIVETANAIANGEGDKGFFRTQAESQIGWAIEFFRAIRKQQLKIQMDEQNCVYPSLDQVLDILTSKESFTKLLHDSGCIDKTGTQYEPAQVDEDSGEEFAPPVFTDEYGNQVEEPESNPSFYSEKLQECIDHFANRYWSQAPDQLSGVMGTIYNYLNYFASDDVAEVFCRENTFDFADIEKGKVICIAMPQKLQIERRYVGTILKILYYKQVLRRFDREGPKSLKNSPESYNLLIAWQDEAQRFFIEEDGNVDVIREAQGTTIMATQMQPSLWIALGNEKKAKVTVGNLRNRFIFRSATKECAEESAAFIGQHEKQKESVTIGKDNRSRSYSPEDTFIVKPYQLQNMKDFTAWICHADGKNIKYIIQARAPDYTPEKWWAQALKTKGLFWAWLLFKLGIRKEFLKIK